MPGERRAQSDQSSGRVGRVSLASLAVGRALGARSMGALMSSKAWGEGLATLEILEALAQKGACPMGSEAGAGVRHFFWLPWQPYPFTEDCPRAKGDS